MHVLPRGFQRVRYYGLLSHRRRATQEQVRTVFQGMDAVGTVGEAAVPKTSQAEQPLAKTGAAVEHGRKRLADDPFSANDGVLAYDGRITAEGYKLDAILLEMRSYGFPWAKAAIAVPYTPASCGRFRVHTPKLVEWHECDGFDVDAAFEAFFRGIDSHKQGAKAWNAALDQSE